MNVLDCYGFEKAIRIFLIYEKAFSHEVNKSRIILNDYIKKYTYITIRIIFFVIKFVYLYK
jgi:hypothetical protein